ncbi:probable protein phosphatase 2C T23F11.1 isoform X1 [Schistocerca gregaria]|uniref:probable protein phosphatase 2C T23F11.1 isoform X1 n=1 Tax=Schistocerca gregaria TaxID=7010 RepID=UPI00211E3E20|nr:probable protein phosphatase 2C T23F11.1 isoform X1 [Schistocerca gregaria]XP_049836081.1 probable protein phosphatase 2C T23F11.1 isoform X1 [Schistocerca gregaria]XP_049836082.1 probable protein phosphatase 2C T23F11.1 isoform X1 [Schistocerca gregaria]
MGQTLSEPVTTKESSCCQNSKLKVGSSCMQGWRITMEDAHTQILSLPDDPGTAFFGVYDGHGGACIAQYAGAHLHNSIVRRPEYKAGNIPEALRKGFLDLDNKMLSDEGLRGELAGSTAIAVLIKGSKLYCVSIMQANVGDSRAVACIAGHVEPLSQDHKPNNEAECRRIVAAGGYVEFNRVNGNLALSRALGDFNFKRNNRKSAEEQMVTAFPDVEIRDITTEWEFIVIACDGIWDVMTNEEVVEFVRMRVGTGMEPEDICQDLMMHCLSPDCLMGGLGCDNMTVVIVCFLHEMPYSSLCDHCAKPVPLTETGLLQ